MERRSFLKLAGGVGAVSLGSDFLFANNAYGINEKGNSMFYDTSSEVGNVGQDLASESTGLFSLIASVVNALDGIGDALFMVMTAPNTIGNLVSGMLEDAKAPSLLANTVGFLIITTFWIVIIFTIISAFLRGGKL